MIIQPKTIPLTDEEVGDMARAFGNRWAKNEIFVNEYREPSRTSRYAGLPTLYPKKVRRFLLRRLGLMSKNALK